MERLELSVSNSSARKRNLLTGSLVEYFADKELEDCSKAGFFEDGKKETVKKYKLDGRVITLHYVERIYGKNRGVDYLYVYEEGEDGNLEDIVELARFGLLKSLY